MRNADGKVVAFLNSEEKKEIDSGLGETCGEMGTLFYVTTEDHPPVKNILNPIIRCVYWSITTRTQYVCKATDSHRNSQGSTSCPSYDR